MATKALAWGATLVGLAIMAGDVASGAAMAADAAAAPTDETSAAPTAEEFRKLIWKRQVGTKLDDEVLGIATDPDGNVVIAGFTHGALGGPSQGARDAFVAKYNGAGDRIWVSQLGTSGWDDAGDVATDAGGNVVITGSSDSSLVGPGHRGCYVARYSAGGDLLWVRQFSTSEPAYPSGVAVDPDGNILISGSTYGSLDGPNRGGADVFVAKYSAAGDRLWVRQLGTDQYESSGGVATDADGNVVISGSSVGPLGGPHHGRYVDIFVAKYGAAGDLLWTRQFGRQPQDEWTVATATDGDGNILVGGYTFASFAGPYQGVGDAFIVKLSAAGDLLWKRQPGTSEDEWTTDIASDVDRNVVITGFTSGALGGPNRGAHDAFIIKYSADGDRLWKRQLGTRKLDWSVGVATDGEGNIVIGGFTTGSLAGPTQGRFDGFFAKFRP